MPTDKRTLQPILVGVATWACLAFLLWALAQWPAVPYNVRELLDGGHPARSAALLSAALWLTVAAPAWVAAESLHRQGAFLAWPIALFLNSLLVWTVLSVAVPSESIHDVVGAPVLHWPGPLETGLRFVALHAGMTLAVWGGVALALLFFWRRHARLLAQWVAWAALLGPLLHWVVVEKAATVNLTELMREGGSPGTTFYLALAAVLTCLSGSIISAAAAFRRGGVMVVTVTAGCAVAAYALYWAGTEPIILKYGKVFSALQFLLSEERSRYVSGGELLVRYGAAYAILTAAVAVLQLPAWMKLAARLEHRQAASKKAQPAPTSAVAAVTSGRHIPSLDGLRGLACLMVFGVHFGQLSRLEGAWGPFDVGRLLANGNTGVALFFVLSGFLLSLPFWANRLGDGPAPAPGSYFGKRAARILPAYFACLTGLIVLNRHWESTHGWADIALHYSLLFNYADWSIFSINPPFWTLAVEVQFYVLLPLLFALTRRFSATATATLLFIAGLACYGVHAWIMQAAATLAEGGERPILAYSLLAHLPHFLLGTITALLYASLSARRQPHPARYDAAVWLSAAAVAAVLATPLDALLQVPHGRYNLPYIPVLLALIVGMAPLAPLARRVLDGAFLRPLGVISYGIYVYHLPLLHFIARTMSGSGFDPVTHWLAFGALALTATVALAAASYWLIERPIVRFFRGARRHGEAPPLLQPAHTG